MMVLHPPRAAARSDRVKNTTKSKNTDSQIRFDKHSRERTDCLQQENDQNDASLEACGSLYFEPSGNACELAFTSADVMPKIYAICHRESDDLPTSKLLPALGPSQVLGVIEVDFDEYDRSVASCPMGSYVVACATFPEQAGYQNVPTSTTCSITSTGNTDVLAVATCSFAGALTENS